MRKRSIAEHDPEVVAQHQIPCGDCSGAAPTASDGASRCDSCHGKKRIGNCSDCRGRGFFTSSGESRGSQSYSGRSCCPCAGKGWVGNCAPCRGLGILDSAAGRLLCPACRGHGHLHQKHYVDDPVHGAASVRVGEAGRFLVPLGEAPVVFGRKLPYASIRVYDARMTTQHFEIYWHPHAMTHEVHDYGRYSLKLNGEWLAGVDDRVRVSGGNPHPGDRRLLADRDVLQIGQYHIEYIARV